MKNLLNVESLLYKKNSKWKKDCFLTMFLCIETIINKQKNKKNIKPEMTRILFLTGRTGSVIIIYTIKFVIYGNGVKFLMN